MVARKQGKSKITASTTVPDTESNVGTEIESTIETDVQTTVSTELQSTIESEVAPQTTGNEEPKTKRKSKVKKEKTAEQTTELTSEIKKRAPKKAKSTEAEVENNDENTKQKNKRNKKNKKNKKPRTASNYVLFSMEHRKTVVEQDNSLTLAEVSKQCGAAWRVLEISEKQKWTEKAHELKRIRAEQEPTVEDSPPKKKRQPSNYLLFSVDYRKKVAIEKPGLSLGELSKICGCKWGTMSDDEKNAWKAAAPVPVDA